jgi:GAF domain-containing protein
MPAPIPKNETKRLKVLWQYDVLDTVPEEIFDDLTDLAASICEAPFAMISLVDEDRQWFKSKTGVTFRETSRDISFCAHAILQKELFIVPDTRKDVRFKSNPLVTGAQKIRFYAGAPLTSPDGCGLGTLCVLDKKPRQLRPEQKRALRILARHVMSQLEHRRTARQLAAARADEKKLRTELAKTVGENARLCRRFSQ